VTQLLSWDSLRELLPVVAHNVAHPDSAVRRATLSILSHFTVPMPEDAPNVCHATTSIYLFFAIRIRIILLLLLLLLLLCHFF
jgi:hypothetical protein